MNVLALVSIVHVTKPPHSTLGSPPGHVLSRGLGPTIARPSCLHLTSTDASEQSRHIQRCRAALSDLRATQEGRRMSTHLLGLEGLGSRGDFLKKLWCGLKDADLSAPGRFRKGMWGSRRGRPAEVGVMGGKDGVLHAEPTLRPHIHLRGCPVEMIRHASTGVLAPRRC